MFTKNTFARIYPLPRKIVLPKNPISKEHAQDRIQELKLQIEFYAGEIANIYANLKQESEQFEYDIAITNEEKVIVANYYGIINSLNVQIKALQRIGKPTVTELPKKRILNIRSAIQAKREGNAKLWKNAKNTRDEITKEKIKQTRDKNNKKGMWFAIRKSENGIDILENKWGVNSFKTIRPALNACNLAHLFPAHTSSHKEYMAFLNFAKEHGAKGIVLENNIILLQSCEKPAVSPEDPYFLHSLKFANKGK